jgi:hypothetical protein
MNIRIQPVYIELEYGAIHSISLLVNLAFRTNDFCEYLFILGNDLKLEL